MSRPKYDTPEKLQKHIDTFFSQNPTGRQKNQDGAPKTHLEKEYKITI